MKEIGPGKDWHGSSWKTNGKFVSTAYKSNATNEVRLWTASDTQVASTGNYAANRLYVTETTDEDNRKVIEYTDLQGRVVRQRQLVSSGVYADTDFAYDDFGRLAYVLPPAISKTSNNTFNFSTLHYLQ